ncbi:protein of unknown function [Agreia sp. COWG]|nr:protein of unknown function [Agreia sp. COWG]
MMASRYTSAWPIGCRSAPGMHDVVIDSAVVGPVKARSPKSVWRSSGWRDAASVRLLSLVWFVLTP